LTTKQQAQFVVSGRIMVGPFQYLIDWWLKFQRTTHFRGREQRVRIYQTILKRNFNECPCSFDPPKSPVVNVRLHQILRFSKQIAEVGPRQPLILGKAWIARSIFPMFMRSCDFLKSQNQWHDRLFETSGDQRFDTMNEGHEAKIRDLKHHNEGQQVEINDLKQ
jgi:hypothetical protein